MDNITENNNNKDWPYRKLIIGPSGSGKTNYLTIFNNILFNNTVNKIYLYAKNLEEPKYKLLIDKREQTGINFNNDPNPFIEYSNSMDDILSDIKDYNKKRKRKVLIIFDDMISHVMSDEKTQQILKYLFIRCRKLNISLCFLTQSYFSVPKDIRLNCTHYISFKLNNKRELQNIAINHSADIDFKDFMTVKDQVKILDRKIKQNRADYDLYRTAAEVSALSSGQLDKYEYLTKKDLGYKPDPLQKAKFEYSLLGSSV